MNGDITIQLGEVWDRKQVAFFHKVTPRTVDRWRENGRLPEPIDYPSGKPRWRASDIIGQVDKSRQK